MNGRILHLAIATAVALSCAAVPGAASTSAVREEASPGFLRGTPVLLDPSPRGSELTAVDGDIAVGTLGGNSAPDRAVAYRFDESPPRRILLGAFDGEVSSTPHAVSGGVVVGQAESAEGTRAFAYDVDALQPELVNLGTLGGSWSSAVDVSGRVVVGTSILVGGGSRAFAYDLDDPVAGMWSLGTLGGGSRATAIDWPIVVGEAGTVGGETHAFAYDLTNPDAGMWDLGTLGGEYSTPVDVSGNLVVGQSDRASGGEHAFTYDLAQPERGMRAILPRQSNVSAAAVDGSVVAGTYWAWVGDRAFAYTHGSTAPGWQNLGAFSDDDLYGSYAYDVSEGVVVGQTGMLGYGTHAFAYDLNGDVPEMIDLGRGDDGSVALAVSSDLVVGFNRSGLAAWRLNRAGTTVRFARPTYVVEESVGRARIALVRSGDLGPSVTLDVATLTGLPWYARRRAVPGVDFVAIEDELTFASGQGRAAFTVPVLDDRVREDHEGFLLSITSDDDQLAISGPSLSGVVIDISDQQPDAVISTRRERGYQGNNVYNTTGVGQTKVQDAPRGARRSFFVHLLNDGQRVVAITTHANPPAPGARIRYFLSGKDVTRALRSPTGLTRYVLNSGGDMADYWPHPVPFRLRVQIEVRAGAPVGSLQTARISAAWRGDHVNRDVVRARVLVTP